MSAESRPERPTPQEAAANAPTKYEEHEGYEKYEDGAGEWRWRQRDGNNRIIAEGGEGYESESGVDRAVENVISEAADAAD